MLFLMHNQQCQSTEGHEERENGKIKRKVLNLLIHTCAQWFGTIGECTATDKTGRRCRDGRLEPYSQTHEVPMKRRRSLALRS